MAYPDDIVLDTADVDGGTARSLKTIEWLAGQLVPLLTSSVTALQLLDNAIAGSEMQVDVVSSALPTGAATAANQATANASLADIAAAAADTTTPSPVKIDQTTDGTTNKVNIVGSLTFATATGTQLDTSTSSQTVLAANSARRAAKITNTGEGYLYIYIGAAAATAANAHERLAQWESFGFSGYTGEIRAISGAGTAGKINIVEFTA